jgi:hypothetical protein
MTSSFNAGITSFKEAYVSAGDDTGTLFDFTSYGGRRLRYSLYQALYDASVYRSEIHGWSKSMRQQYALYRYIRQIEAPASTIVTFWQTHLFGGALDPQAGDGSSDPSAIPIITDNEMLRPSIAQLWAWSNWATKKDTFALDGAKLGDVGLRIVDDVGRQKVYLQIVHPAMLTDMTLDPFGNVKAYCYQEPRVHPITGKAVLYKEEVGRDGENVTYTTYLDNQLFAWPTNVDAMGNARAQWQEPYGFVPFIWVNHIDTGTEFGLSELHQGLAAFREIDDIASALDDQIRKAVNSPWLLAGVQDPKLARRTDPSIPQTTATAASPEPGRQEVPLLYGPVGATATPLVFPLDITGTNTRIEALHAKLRRDYPELDADLATDAGDASGRALRVKRQRAEVKVNLRRSTYDDALVRAQKMGVAIAGWRRLKGFEAFGLESAAQGTLDHQIGARPVFATSVMDQLEEDQAFWLAAGEATKASYPLELFLRDHQWSEERIAAYMGVEQQRQARADAANQAKIAAAQAQQQGTGDVPPVV